MRHSRQHRLQKCVDAAGAGWRAVTSGGTWRRHRHLTDYLRFCRALEVTESPINGFHVHFHAVLVFASRPSYDALATLADGMCSRRSAALVKAGMPAPDRDLGLDVQQLPESDRPEKDVAGWAIYLAKGVAAESVLGVTKEARAPTEQSVSSSATRAYRSGGRTRRPTRPSPPWTRPRGPGWRNTSVSCTAANNSPGPHAGRGGRDRCARRPGLAVPGWPLGSAPSRRTPLGNSARWAPVARQPGWPRAAAAPGSARRAAGSRSATVTSSADAAGTLAGGHHAAPAARPCAAESSPCRPAWPDPHAKPSCTYPPDGPGHAHGSSCGTKPRLHPPATAPSRLTPPRQRRPERTISGKLGRPAGSPAPQSRAKNDSMIHNGQRSY